MYAIDFFSGIEASNTTIGSGHSIASSGSLVFGQDQDSMGGAFNDASNKYYGFVTDIDNVSSAANSAIADFRVGSASKVFFDINGYVGIGTTAPLATLDVRGDISGSGSFLGTGAGNRITNNGTPYLLSGDSPAETQTLQDVTDNGNTTTTNISGAEITGTVITAPTGTFFSLRSDEAQLRVGTKILLQSPGILHSQFSMSV